MNYEGLNENLIALSSPAAQTPPTPFYQMDSQTEQIGATRLAGGAIHSAVLVYVGKTPQILIGYQKNGF